MASGACGRAPTGPQAVTARHCEACCERERRQPLRSAVARAVRLRACGRCPSARPWLCSAGTGLMSGEEQATVYIAGPAGNWKY